VGRGEGFRSDFIRPQRVVVESFARIEFFSVFVHEILNIECGGIKVYEMKLTVSDLQILKGCDLGDVLLRQDAR